MSKKNEDDDKLYKTTNIIVKKSQDDLFEYCDSNSKEAKLFKNATIYRCRQLYFAFLKGYKDLDDAQIEVIKEFKQVGVTFPLGKSRYLPGYTTFVKMFTVTNNPDYFNELPQQSSQQMIKEVLEDFKGFNEAFFEYRKNPSKFTGKPKPPSYVKSDITTFTITNQDTVIKEGNVMKLPKTKVLLHLGGLEIGKLKVVKIEPYYDTYKIGIVEELEEPAPSNFDRKRALSLDLGIDNFVSSSNNCGLVPFVINGNDLKSYNQWYNKTIANYKSKLPTNVYSSKRIVDLNQHYKNKTTDFYNKAASFVTTYCVQKKIDTIVIGKNFQWKSKINMGKENNQSFCFIGHTIFIKKVQEMAKLIDIEVIVTEESYTSKASFLDGDEIPIYKKDDNTKYHFSGRRIHRGLYKSKDGILINADVNGASNILRKAIPNAFDGIKDFSYLYKTTIKVNFYNKEKPIKMKDFIEQNL